MKYVLTFLFIALLGCSAAPPPTKESVISVLRGVLEGISEESHISVAAIEECVTDSQTVVGDLFRAVELIKTKDINNVKQGIKFIGEAIQVLPDAITQCKSGEQEAQQIAALLTKLLGELRHPMTFAYEVGKHLLVNGANIYKEVTTAVSDWDSNNTKDFGDQIGKILYQLLLSTSLTQQQDQVALTVFVGVLEGFATEGGIHVEDVQACIKDTEFVVTNFVGAVKDFESNDAKKILDGLKLLGQGLQVLPDAITACQATVSEAVVLAAKLTAATKNLASPTTFAFHVGKDLIVNGRDIYKEITTAVKDWNNQDYKDFGFQIGEALYQVFVGQQFQMLFATEPNASVPVQVFVGFLKGFANAGGVHVEDVESCIQGSVQVVQDFEQAVKLFETKKAKEVLQGLELLAEGLKVLPAAIRSCQATVQASIALAVKLEQVITQIANPSQYSFHVGKDIVVNGKSIFKEINAAVSDWKQKNYSDFGFQIGTAFYQVFVGAQKKMIVLH